MKVARESAVLSVSTASMTLTFVREHRRGDLNLHLYSANRQIFVSYNDARLLMNSRFRTYNNTHVICKNSDVPLGGRHEPVCMMMEVVRLYKA